MNLIILDRPSFSKALRDALTPRFPELSVYAFSREEEIGDLISQVHILFLVEISDDLIKRASNLKWIQAKTTGVEKIVTLPSLRKEVLITSTRGIHVSQMSEMAILLMLALNRNFPEHIRNQDRRIWKQWPGQLLRKKKVGILGVGAIGEGIARQCKAFNMEVLGIDIVTKQTNAIDRFYSPEELIGVVREVDYFVIVAPLTSRTKNMINARILSEMKPSSYLINLGRGEIVDEMALIQALNARKIAGAALDVFSTEPLPQDHPLWHTKHLIITPHVGGRSDVGLQQVLSVFEENLKRFLRGNPHEMINLVKR